MIDNDKPDLTAALAHYGVKGMKWGVRRNTPDSRGVTPKQARKERRGIRRKASDDLEDFLDSPGKTRDAMIKDARENLKKANREYRNVKRDLKERRNEVGRNRVKVSLQRARSENMKVNFMAQQDTRVEESIRVGVEILDAVIRNNTRSAPTSTQRRR